MPEDKTVWGGYIVKCTNPQIAFKDVFDAKNFTCRDFSSLENVAIGLIENLRVKKKDKYALKGNDAIKYEQISLLDVS